MKKVLLFLLLILTFYIVLSLFFLDKYYFIYPINYRGDFIIRTDSMGDGLFGSRRSGRRMHQGIDLFADIGEPVLAARSGIVALAKGGQTTASRPVALAKGGQTTASRPVGLAKNSRGMGNYIVLRHNLSLITIYGHLSEIYVRKNQFVRQGDIIGAVGKTGNANYRSMQSHLHFEIRRNGIPQDPLEYLD